MIYTERVINVKNGAATIDQPIVLFRGDRNIEIVFEIVNSKFKFSEKGNYILDIGAKYGQLAVDMPDGTDLFTEIAECLDGKVIFKITGDMINEIAENGFYSFHVRLFNEDKTSRVTIPPIMEGIEVREPIVIEGDAIFPIVDMGGADIAPIDSDEETFIDENGKLNIVWQNGDIISSTRLNQMVEFINVMEEKLVSEDNLKDYATIEYVDIELDNIHSLLYSHEGLINDIESTAEQAKNIATEARFTIDSKYNELSEQIDQLIINDDRFEASIATAEAKAEAAFEEVKNRATNVYVDQKDSELLAKINELQNGLADYATTEYVDGEINKLEEKVDVLNEEITNAGVDMLREDLEGIRTVVMGIDLSLYATEEYVNTVQDNINETIGGLQDDITEEISTQMTSFKDETLNVIDEQFTVQNDRISEIENVVADIPDLSGYATTEYVEGEINPILEQIDVLSTYKTRHEAETVTLGKRIMAVEEKIVPIETSVAEHDVAIIEINDTIGDINSILDAINGEVI